MKPIKRIRTRKEQLREVHSRTRDSVVQAINELERDDPEMYVIVWQKGARMEYRVGPGTSITKMVGFVERAKFLFLHDEEH